ncbi:DUF7144 family membrane protein [Streptomyces sp. NBC_01465]|uniref:DUF7144 family membrane protein n=1 Tax=Streptomyces sp. NBC_01465 TaxID=2903878 RepID=UPI002E313275|nr:hypothetical protein [Streptomyces sp. NBC_01465]
MSQQAAQPPRSSGSAWAAGGTMFAGVLMVIEGIMGFLQGLVAIHNDDIYTRVGDYIYSFNLTSWGWVHLIVGVLVAGTGFGILLGQEWARFVGIGLASLNIVLQFMFLPYQPIWALTTIALGVFIVWALATDQPVKPAQGGPKTPPTPPPASADQPLWSDPTKPGA